MGDLHVVIRTGGTSWDRPFLVSTAEVDGSVRTVEVDTPQLLAAVAGLAAEHAVPVTLWRLRRARSWTQADFCRVFEATSRDLGTPLSLSVRQLRRWETGTPPPRPQPAYERVLLTLFGIPLDLLGFPPVETTYLATAHRRDGDHG